MQNLIKNGELTASDWNVLEKPAGPDALRNRTKESLIVPLNFWQLYRAESKAYSGNIGLWLDSDELINDVSHEINEFPVIAFNFPAFSDGRPYTNARELRQNLNYRGEIRAIGDVLRDQIFYMSCCGFDAFQLRQDQDPQACIDALRDFQETYQSTAADPSPLFRRR